MEIAFAKAQARDLGAARQLAQSGRPEEWGRINRIHRRVGQQQSRIEPLLPLISEDGYRAHFDFVDIDQMESESRERAAEYLYERARTLLEKGRQGDRQAARQAYWELRNLEERYFRHYRDKDELMREAVALGTTRIGFEVANWSSKLLPARFEDHLLAFNIDGLNAQWKRFHLGPPQNMMLDYRAIFALEYVDVSPERIRERTYTEERDVEEGWEYVLDERGNVRKDSLGNDLKQPRIVRVHAEVLEVYQSKAARLDGALEICDNRGALLFRQPMSTEVFFEHYSATFRGDRRALSPESCSRIGNIPLPFPSDEDMLLQAAERLKVPILNELRSNRHIW